MLYDPKIELKHKLRQIMRKGGFQPTNPSAAWKNSAQPSMRGFAAFVEMKAMEAPEEEYYFPDAEACAVGQYLKEIDAYDDSYEDENMYRDMVHLAGGEGRWSNRDAKGRFKKREKPLWSWAALQQRIRDKFAIDF